MLVANKGDGDGDGDGDGVFVCSGFGCSVLGT